MPRPPMAGPASATFAHLSRAGARDYIAGMMKFGLSSHGVASALAAVVLSAATGLAFAGWVEHGAGMFMSLAETGLSWCF